MKFATISFSASGSNTSRCHHCCSVHDVMGAAIQKKIDDNGHYNFKLDDGTILSQVVVCSITDRPVATMNHFGYLTRLLGVRL